MTHDSHDSHGASPGLRPRLLQRRGVVDIRKHVGRQYSKGRATQTAWDILSLRHHQNRKIVVVRKWDSLKINSYSNATNMIIIFIYI